MQVLDDTTEDDAVVVASCRAPSSTRAAREVVTVRGPATAIETSLRSSGAAFSRTDVAKYAHAVRQRTVH